MNLIETVLTEAGLVKNKTFKQTRFKAVPGVDFAVWTDQVEADGSDQENLFFRHSATVEMYMYQPDETVLRALLRALNLKGIKYTASDKTWLQSEQFYLVYVYFDWVE